MKLPAIKFLLFCLFFSFSFSAKAGLYYELSLSEKVKNADIIVEGKVVSIKAEKDNNNQITTKYIIEITRKYKSDKPALPSIEITTLGGILDNEAAGGDCFHYPHLFDYGIFFIEDYLGLNRIYGEKQGFVKIDKANGMFTDFFHQFPDGKNTWLPQLLALCPNAENERTESQNYNQKSTAMVNITSIQPLVETAGTGAQLTIKGFGLGANQFAGTLYFTNANDGGLTYIAAPNELIVKWTDTEIICKIPAQAGTGRIRIENAGGFDVSLQTLTLKAARLNTGENNALYESRLVKRNPNGGYLLNLNEKFAQDENASQTLSKALIQWRCKTGVNWTIGKTIATTGTARDTLNVVSFDDKNQLPAGAIGLCYSYYKSCGSNVWYLDEFDMLFKENFNWYFGNGTPSINQYDFYTVALHEFGHAHQLGHVIKPTDLMHYSIGPAEIKRNISDDNSDICYEIISESVTKNTCDFTAHQLIPNSVCADEKFGFFSPLIYPNPAPGQFNIELFFSDNKPITLQLFSINGQMVFEKQYSPPNPERLLIDIPMRDNNLNSGVYVLKIFGEFELATKKIILY